MRAQDGDRPIRYIVSWESTQLDYTLEQGASAGRLDNVTGKLFQDGKVASEFSADSAIADKSKNLLILEGNVKVRSLAEPSGRLDCKKLEWKTDEKLIKAHGNVTIEVKQGKIGPVGELWCLPDLKRAGTPGFYGG